jgi:hypothetical protein
MNEGMGHEVAECSLRLQGTSAYSHTGRRWRGEQQGLQKWGLSTHTIVCKLTFYIVQDGICAEGFLLFCFLISPSGIRTLKQSFHVKMMRLNIPWLSNLKLRLTEALNKLGRLYFYLFFYLFFSASQVLFKHIYRATQPIATIFLYWESSFSVHYEYKVIFKYILTEKI